MEDNEIHIKDNIIYKIVDYHRRRPNPEKSVWDRDVSVEDEIGLFKEVVHNKWIVEDLNKQKHLGWGILSYGTRLGTGITPEKKPLYVAKFKDENLNEYFHGYPIDYTCVHDRVPKSILKDWKKETRISKAQMSRMGRGFDCH
ncbi:hypothetical protein M3182_16565 [Mesobacillus maritimus]|uniref:hypothetical protein n=1 Tax=Mesobacillus maritimus TaxID=1643336 RepID=UPI002040D59D|nr:hypothetical protein [Mesobacillus maritimus]MCM3587352.1 hypothetical protein [Mesobacillus maritimus]